MEQTPATLVEPVPLRLRAAFLHWAACLVGWFGLMVLASQWELPDLTALLILAYPLIGLYLSRAVLRRVVEWHPNYNTLVAVTSGKLKFFLFWPVAYAVLFFRLGVDKVL